MLRRSGPPLVLLSVRGRPGYAFRVAWWWLGLIVLLVTFGLIESRSPRRHRRATQYARHPWLTGAAFGVAFGLGPLIGFWPNSPKIAIAGALFWAVIFAVIHGLAWEPEGYERLRYIRRYGAPPEWPEHRWLPGDSNWEDSNWPA
jgi:hypothetical protein